MLDRTRRGGAREIHGTAETAARYLSDASQGTHTTGLRSQTINAPPKKRPPNEAKDKDVPFSTGSWRTVRLTVL